MVPCQWIQNYEVDLQVSFQNVGFLELFPEILMGVCLVTCPGLQPPGYEILQEVQKLLTALKTTIKPDSLNISLLPVEWGSTKTQS